MGFGDSRVPLSELQVLVVDCQATAAAPRGDLLEVGWARAGPAATTVQTRLVALPVGHRIPPAVARITGISERMAKAGVPASAAWRALAAEAAGLDLQPAPTVIHFARFEQPFLRHFPGEGFPMDVVCTHEIARRLLPDLPRRTLRALAGYFGRAVGELRRSADHVSATAFVWRELVRLLDGVGISTWSELKGWLAQPVRSPRARRRVWPMPRDLRLSLPDAPGVYRMLRTSGDVLYVGKAASLCHRVNSYFRHQRGVPERMLEMLSQARGISFEVMPTALEAALAECDEIKRLRPPYNVALTEVDRQVWFAAADLAGHAGQPSRRCPIGPFGSVETLEQFGELVRASPTALGRGRWAPNAAIFADGYARFRAAHAELRANGAAAPASLLRLGTRLWRQGRRDRDADDGDGAGSHARRVAEWSPESVHVSLERLAIRAALARRRAGWLTRLTDATVVWCEPGDSALRLLVVENGEIATGTTADPSDPVPIPPGCQRSIEARHAGVTVASFDRLRVLTTELKRIVGAGAPVFVRLGPAPPLTGARLASLLTWL